MYNFGSDIGSNLRAMRLAELNSLLELRRQNMQRNIAQSEMQMRANIANADAATRGNLAEYGASQRALLEGMREKFRRDLENDRYRNELNLWKTKRTWLTDLMENKVRKQNELTANLGELETTQIPGMGGLTIGEVLSAMETGHPLEWQSSYDIEQYKKAMDWYRNKVFGLYNQAGVTLPRTAFESMMLARNPYAVFNNYSPSIKVENSIPNDLYWKTRNLYEFKMR